MLHPIIILLFWFMNVQNENPKPQKVVFFGDSITEAGVNPGGYIALLKDLLQENGKTKDYELIGSGIGGNKVYDLFFRLEKDVLSRKPDIVVIWIGVNDVWHKSSFGTGTDADKFELMYKDIISRLQNQGIKVFCGTPACIGEKTDHSNQQDGDLNSYSSIIRNIAASKGVGLMDFRSKFLEYNMVHNKNNRPSGILTTDGVHLNDKGNNLVAQLIFETIFK
jgi:isoamyl acetate esterase